MDSNWRSQVGAAWSAVPRAAGNITVKLPYRTTFTGPSWKYLSDNMATKSGGAVPVNQGCTGSTIASSARTNLGLGTLVTQEDQSIAYGPSQEHALVVRKDEWSVVVSDNGNPVPLGTRYGGTGATTGDYWRACANIGAIRQKTARFAPGDTPTNIYRKINAS